MAKDEKAPLSFLFPTNSIQWFTQRGGDGSSGDPPPSTLWNNGVISNIFNRCAIITLINWKTKRLICTSQNKCCLAQFSSLCLGFCSCGFAVSQANLQVSYYVKKYFVFLSWQCHKKKSISYIQSVYLYIKKKRFRKFRSFIKTCWRSNKASFLFAFCEESIYMLFSGDSLFIFLSN